MSKFIQIGVYFQFKIGGGGASCEALDGGIL